MVFLAGKMYPVLETQPSSELKPDFHVDSHGVRSTLHGEVLVLKPYIWPPLLHPRTSRTL